MPSPKMIYGRMLELSYLLSPVHFINCPPNNTLVKVFKLRLKATWLLRREGLLLRLSSSMRDNVLVEVDMTVSLLSLSLSLCYKYL